MDMGMDMCTCRLVLKPENEIRMQPTGHKQACMRSERQKKQAMQCLFKLTPLLGELQALALGASKQ